MFSDVFGIAIDCYHCAIYLFTYLFILFLYYLFIYLPMIYHYHFKNGINTTTT